MITDDSLAWIPLAKERSDDLLQSLNSRSDWKTEHTSTTFDPEEFQISDNVIVSRKELLLSVVLTRDHSTNAEDKERAVELAALCFSADIAAVLNRSMYIWTVMSSLGIVKHNKVVDGQALVRTASRLTGSHASSTQIVPEDVVVTFSAQEDRHISAWKFEDAQCTITVGVNALDAAEKQGRYANVEDNPVIDSLSKLALLCFAAQRGLPFA